MERKVHVIPFRVHELAEKVNEVPKGVEMIQAQKSGIKQKERASRWPYWIRAAIVLTLT
jgi:hypothetical protein